jgi:hypothetical protein
VASAYVWVTRVLSMVKQTHIFHILKGYGPTLPSFSLTTRRKHSENDIKIVEELPLGFPSRSCHQSTVAKVTSRCSCINPNPLVEAP